jgi:hypothetical protein
MLRLSSGTGWLRALGRNPAARQCLEHSPERYGVDGLQLSANSRRLDERYQRSAPTGYFVFALYALFSPSDDPQRGMAQGFITMVAIVLLSLGGALWFAVARNHPWLLRFIFVIAIFPALGQTAQEIYLLMRRGP